MSFGRPESLLTRCDLTANPTSASRRAFFLRPPQKKVQPASTSLNKTLPLQGDSLRAAISTLYPSSSLPTRAIIH